MNYFIIPGLEIINKLDLTQMNNKQRVSTIIRVVNYETGIDMDQIKVKCRTGYIRDTRHVLAYLLKKHTLLTYQNIADELERTHATIIHSFNVVSDQIEFNQPLGKLALKIEEKLIF